MKKVFYTILTLIFVGLIGSICFLGVSNKNLREDLDRSTANEKAYIAENDNLKEESRVFQLTVEQLEYSQDSLVRILNKARKDLKIKDKNIKNLSYLLSEAEKVDSIHTVDTIFRDKEFSLDTLMGDRWFNCRVALEYPNKITVTPKYRNELIITTSSRKETINPPKKCFLGRWFQKKHTVVIVDAFEYNPYAEIKKQRHIEIVK